MKAILSRNTAKPVRGLNAFWRRSIAYALLVSGNTLAAVEAAVQSVNQPNAVIDSEFIFETAPFRSCHASTIAETKGGLAAAWFGGTAEKNRDVTIWSSRHNGQRWTPPTEVATGLEAGDQQRYTNQFPCWNPVFFQASEGPLLLFYKVGPDPAKWWGMMKTSTDGGKTWSTARKLPEGFLGPIKDKPVALADGTLLCPSSTEHDGWRIHLERTPDLGATWAKTPPLNDGKEFAAIQPTVLFHPNGRLQLLCRSRQRVITECWSNDSGKTWSEMKATALPNPNSGIDAVTLKDGRQLLIYNHTTTGRTPLNLAISGDGKNWKQAATLESEPGEYSYPAILQTRDGLVHATYTWKRQRVKHLVIDPRKL